MKRSLPFLAFTLALVWSMLFLTAPAKAYLDPGAGSYFMQVLMAVLLGAAFSVRVYMQRVRSMFRSNSNRGQAE